MITTNKDFTIAAQAESDAYHENIAVYDVLNDHFDGNWKDVLTANLYTPTGERIGSLRELHFIYDVENNKLEGAW